ncbi:hypothetical protein [Azospirillum argentinense]
MVIEFVGEGTDTVRSAIDYTLGDNVEALVLTGAALVGTGNALNNSLTGTAAANVLSGLDGDDTLTGGAGADTLDGGATTPPATPGLRPAWRWTFQRASGRPAMPLGTC